MSKAFNSPTGRLLRSSRLFSLPPPLPQPQLENMTSAGILRSSDTATLPYPIRQAIATPTSSRHRGDWGLKRALPQRSTNSSTPHLRINAIDNLEHITDFDSAADHTQNLAKWQEMNIPMVPRAARNSVSGYSDKPMHSVFEDELDNTAYQGSGTGVNQVKDASERALLLRAIQPSGLTRWKTQGPWVAGMSEDQFQQFLDKESKKPDFLKFVRQAKVDQRRSDAIQRIREERGYDPENSQDMEEVSAAAELSDVEFKDHLKELRDSHENLSSELTSLIQEFYDLPPLVTENPGSALERRMVEDVRGGDADVGPPVTHPSAGLSYLRTKAYMDNHPLFGPQAQHSPIEARVVRPRTMAQGGTEQARIGVGGFVTIDPTKKSFQMNNPKDQSSLTERLFPELEGGNKIWVHPEKAYVDENGRVHIDIEHGQKQAIEVKTGEIDPNRDDQTSSSRILPGVGVGGRLGGTRLDEFRSPRGTFGNANYGTALPDLRNKSRGFDEEIKKGGQGGQSAADVFRGLVEKSTQQR